MDIDSIIETSSCPIFVTDDKFRIVAINRSARQALGFTAGQIRTRRCYDLLCGRDPFGNRFCHKDCAVSTMARAGEPVRYFEMEVVVAGGQRARAGFATLVLGAADSETLRIVHIMSPVPGQTSEFPAPAAPPEKPPEDSPPSRFTPREIEVIGLLSEGAGCAEIARRCQVRPSTIRNRLQRIFRKLSVHGQLEAVAAARRIGLVPPSPTKTPRSPTKRDR